MTYTESASYVEFHLHGLAQGQFLPLAYRMQRNLETSRAPLVQALEGLGCPLTDRLIFIANEGL
jgi:hypothetical protein